MRCTGLYIILEPWKWLSQRMEYATYIDCTGEETQPEILTCSMSADRSCLWLSPKVKPMEWGCMARGADVTRKRRRLLTAHGASEHWHVPWQVYAPERILRSCEHETQQRNVLARIATHRRATLPAEEKPTLHTLEKSDWHCYKTNVCINNERRGESGRDGTSPLRTLSHLGVRVSKRNPNVKLAPTPEFFTLSYHLTIR